jgi:hypothetical protein
MVEVYPGPQKRTDSPKREKTVGVYDRKRRGPSRRMGTLALVIIAIILLVIFLVTWARAEPAGKEPLPGATVSAFPMETLSHFACAPQLGAPFAGDPAPRT